MARSFDVYHKWLSIPPSEQPPNHYRLLGLGLFESDPDVIQAAADRQMAHVQTYKNGPMSELSQKLLNEISAAKLCLLRPNKKAPYDEQLRQQVAAAVPVMGASIAAPAMVAAPPAVANPQGPPAFPAPPAPPPNGAAPGLGANRSTATIPPPVPARRTSLTATAPPPVAPAAQLDERHPLLSGKMALLAAVAGVAVLLAVTFVAVSLLREKSPLVTGTGNGGNEIASSVDPARPASSSTASTTRPGTGDGTKTGVGSSPAIRPGNNTVVVPVKPPISNDVKSPAGTSGDPKKILPKQDHSSDPAVAPNAADHKPPAPKAEAMADAERRLGKIAAHSALEWLEQSRGMKPNADCYVAIHRAIESSINVGDVAVATQAVDELAKRFDVKPFDLRIQTLSDLRSHIETPAGWSALADAALTLSDDAAEKAPPLAMRAAELSLGAARKSGDNDLIKRATLQILRLRAPHL